MIIKPHRRTIYFNFDTDSKNRGLKKYTLNIPAMNFVEIEIGSENYYFIEVFDEHGKECHAPFTNLHKDGEVCMGDCGIYDEEEFVNKFFNSVFTLSLPYEIKNYLNLENTTFTNETIQIWYDAVDEFYCNWQETGKLRLILKSC